MSAGAFVSSVYAASYPAAPLNHPIRVQPETLLAEISPAGGGTPVVNAAAVGAIGSPISAQVSRSRRALGLHARTVTVKIRDGAAPPTGYKAGSIVRIPALTVAFFNAAIPGNSVSYVQSTNWVVVGRSAEVVR